jgi:excisionase family DNA binding protein
MYLTINETAELLQVSEQTVRKYAKWGEIPPPLKIGGSLRWDADELQTYIRNNNQSEATNETN